MFSCRIILTFCTGGLARFHFTVFYVVYKYVSKLGFEALLDFHKAQFAPFVWIDWPSFVLGFLMPHVNMY